MNYLVTRKRGSKLTLRTFCAIVSNILRSLLSIPGIIIEFALHRDHNALHGPTLTGRKILGNSQADLQLFKDIAKLTKCTINDILIFCICAAFKKEDPSASSIRIVQAVGAIKPGSFGVQNSTIIASFDAPLQGENVLDHFRKICDIMHRFKSSEKILAFVIMVFLGGNHLPLFLATSRIGLPDVTLAVSNLQGAIGDIIALGDLGLEATGYPMNFCKTGMMTE